jgi:hypothetical protein
MTPEQAFVDADGFHWPLSDRDRPHLLDHRLEARLGVARSSERGKSW